MNPSSPFWRLSRDQTQPEEEPALPRSPQRELGCSVTLGLRAGVRRSRVSLKPSLLTPGSRAVALVVTGHHCEAVSVG